MSRFDEVAPEPDVTRAPRPRACVELNSTEAQRRRAIALHAGDWCNPPESTRPPRAPTPIRPVGGNVATKRRYAGAA